MSELKEHFIKGAILLFLPIILSGCSSDSHITPATQNPFHGTWAENYVTYYPIGGIIEITDIFHDFRFADSIQVDSGYFQDPIIPAEIPDPIINIHPEHGTYTIDLPLTSTVTFESNRFNIKITDEQDTLHSEMSGCYRLRGETIFFDIDYH